MRGRPGRIPLWVAPVVALSLILAVAFLGRQVPRESAEASVTFTMCPDRIKRNCVIDGDTFRLDGERIRIEDIDAPEVFSPRCTRERAIGIQAKQELLALLNDGQFTLARYQDNERETYGRKLWAVERGGRSIGRWNERERDWYR